MSENFLIDNDTPEQRALESAARRALRNETYRELLPQLKKMSPKKILLALTLAGIGLASTLNEKNDPSKIPVEAEQMSDLVPNSEKVQTKKISDTESVDHEREEKSDDESIAATKAMVSQMSEEVSGAREMLLEQALNRYIALFSDLFEKFPVVYQEYFISEVWNDVKIIEDEQKTETEIALEGENMLACIFDVYDEITTVLKKSQNDVDVNDWQQVKSMTTFLKVENPLDIEIKENKPFTIKGTGKNQQEAIVSALRNGVIKIAGPKLQGSQSKSDPSEAVEGETDRRIATYAYKNARVFIKKYRVIESVKNEGPQETTTVEIEIHSGNLQQIHKDNFDQASIT